MTQGPMGAYKAKRQFMRSILKEGVRIMTPQGPEYSTSEDVSAGGVKIWLDRDVAIGSFMEVQFSLRSPQTGRLMTEVKTLGKVVRSVKSQSGYQVGLQFVDLQEKVREVIQSFGDDAEGPF